MTSTQIEILEFKQWARDKIPLDEQKIEKVLIHLFPDLQRRKYGEELVLFVKENFSDAEFIITFSDKKQRISDLRVRIKKGYHFFILRPTFEIIVYLPTSIRDDLFRRDDANCTINGTNSLNLIKQEQGIKKIKNYIEQSYKNREGKQQITSVKNTDNFIQKKTQDKLTMLKISLNTILYGAPGTGKTYSTIEKALEIIDQKFLDEKRSNRAELKSGFDACVMKGQISFVTFHQSFSYEEFVEGIRAETTEDGQINYSVEDGIFKAICKKADEDSEQNYVLIIDEINRGNISKIFGELITLIEESKRFGNKEALTVTLPYSNKPFSVPNNLYIIGTMNTADRSLALMDTALRRRFDFVEMMPQPELLREISVGGVDIEKMLTTMNKRITVLYDREHTLGHAFFMSLTNESTIHDLANIFKNKIIPLLQEYFFEDWEKIRKVLGDDKAKTKIPFIAKEDLNGLFEDEFDDESSILYTLNEKVLVNAESYKNIYE